MATVLQGPQLQSLEWSCLELRGDAGSGCAHCIIAATAACVAFFPKKMLFDRKGLFTRSLSPSPPHPKKLCGD